MPSTRLPCSRRLALATVLLVLLPGFAGAQEWRKYVAPDRSFSFHYPAGWRVTQSADSLVEVSNAAKDEQLLVVAVPFERRRSPRELATGMVEIFRKDMPDLEASGWRTEGDSVYFQVAYTQKRTRYSGDVVVVKGENGAHWISYSAPVSGYWRQEAIALLQAVIGSVAKGTGSAPPAGAQARAPRDPRGDRPGQAARRGPAGASVDRISTNAHAVLWVMEFALGAPLTLEQEQFVVGKLRAVWSARPEAEVAEFDTYPELLHRILGMGQRDVESARRTLAQTFRGWFEQAQASDPVMASLKAAFADRPRILTRGTPPLTEPAATAYCEMVTYGRLLQDDPGADPDSLPPGDVAALRRQLVEQWADLPPKDRDDIASLPGVWICSRTLIRYGSADDRRATRQKLARLAPPRESATAPAGRAPMSMTTHNVLMNINQMTFSHYMWTHGFTSTMR